MKIGKYVRIMLLSAALGLAVWGLSGCKGEKSDEEGTGEPLAAAVQVTRRAEEETAGQNREDEEKKLEGSLVSGDGTVLWEAEETGKDEDKEQEEGETVGEERQEMRYT